MATKKTGRGRPKKNTIKGDVKEKAKKVAVKAQAPKKKTTTKIKTDAGSSASILSAVNREFKLAEQAVKETEKEIKPISESLKSLEAKLTVQKIEAKKLEAMRDELVKFEENWQPEQLASVPEDKKSSSEGAVVKEEATESVKAEIEVEKIEEKSEDSVESKEVEEGSEEEALESEAA